MATTRKTKPKPRPYTEVFRVEDKALFWLIEPHNRTLIQSDGFRTTLRRVRFPRSVIGIIGDQQQFVFGVVDGRVREIDGDTRAVYDMNNLGNTGSLGWICLGQGLRSNFKKLDSLLENRLTEFFTRSFSKIPAKRVTGRGDRFTIREICYQWAHQRDKSLFREHRFVSLPEAELNRLYNGRNAAFPTTFRTKAPRPKRGEVVVSVCSKIGNDETFDQPLSFHWYDIWEVARA